MSCSFPKLNPAFHLCVNELRNEHLYKKLLLSFSCSNAAQKIYVKYIY